MMYLINDTAKDDSTVAHFKRFGLEVISAQSLSAALASHSQWKKFNPSRTLLIFPGNGGDIIRSYLPSEWLNTWQWMTVFAKRLWMPGTPPQAFASQISPSKLLLGLLHIVVVDDVVSSGETARMLKERNEPWIPGAEWHVATWITQKAANLPGFSSTLTVHAVGERNRKVPINSLSTFLSVPEIAENYARRNLDGQANAFLEFIAELRNMHR